MLYWLCGLPFVVAGGLVGHISSFFMSGFKMARDLHQRSIDIWDSRYNEP